MTTRTFVRALGGLAATLLVADGAHAGGFGGDHHGVAHAGGLHASARPGWEGGRARWGGGFYPGTYDRAGWYYGDWGWDAAAAANVAAKSAARAAYDAHSYDFLHRCYEPQRIWNGAYYSWRLVSVC